MTAIFGAQLMTAFRQHSNATLYRARHTAQGTRVQIPPAHQLNNKARPVRALSHLEIGI